MTVIQQSGKTLYRPVLFTLTWWRLAVAALFLVAILFPSMNMQMAQSQSLPNEQFDHIHDLISTNTVDLQKSHPFHIKISFTLNDLTGLEKERGTIESWWWSPRGRRIEVNAPSYRKSEPEQSNQERHTNRESYLTDQLLSSFTRPVPVDFLYQGAYAPTETDETRGTYSFRCIVRRPANQPVVTVEMSRFCTEVGSYTLVEELGAGDMRIVRGSPRTFHAATVPSKITIFYLGKPAISGTIETLEDMTIDSAGADPPNRPANSSTPVDSTMLTGLRLSARTPVFPKAARKAHQHGSVTISAIIDKEGKLRDLDIIATPNDLFSQSALEAVKTWTYKPYLLNGSPAEVDTAIFVNYNIGR